MGFHLAVLGYVFFWIGLLTHLVAYDRWWTDTVGKSGAGRLAILAVVAVTLPMNFYEMIIRRYFKEEYEEFEARN